MKIIDIKYLFTVYVFIGEHIALIDFLFCMQQRNLLDQGDYIIISVDEEIYNPQMEKGKGSLNFSQYCCVLPL